MDLIEQMQRAITSIRGAPTIDTPRIALEQVIHELGTDVLRMLTPCPNSSASVGGVAIYDPEENGTVPPAAIALGVGVTKNTVDDVVEDIVAQGGLALVVRLPLTVEPALQARLDQTGLTLLGFAPGVTWHQLTTMLGTVLSNAAAPAWDEQTDSFAGGDLFGLASAICTLIDAPVTIEDRNANVLAFSERQDEADYIRIQTILSRRVPDIYSLEDDSRGASKTIRQSLEPVFLPAIDLGNDKEAMPRVAVAVRAGDEFLGTVWAVVAEPLSPEKNALLLDASRLVARRMLRLRAGADTAQRMRNDLVAASLGNDAAARQALTRLGLSDLPVTVVAFGNRDSRRGDSHPDPFALAQLEATTQRTAAALSLHLATIYPGSAVAAVNGVIYALVPTLHADDAGAGIEATCRRFLQYRSGPTTLCVGIGRVAVGAQELVRSRGDADRTVRVLRRPNDLRTVAQAADVEIEAVLLDVADIVQANGRGPTGPYARLLGHDRLHNTEMLTTLRAWLDAHGDVGLAAANSHVHPNTIRYRIKRITEIGEVDLEDPGSRFALDLQFRLFPPGC